MVLKEPSRFPFFFNTKAPNATKIMWENALNTIIIGKPANRKPKPVIMVTDTATTGDIKIEIKIGTWLASVKDAGPIIILGKTIGIMIPSAQSNAATVMAFTLIKGLDILKLPSFSIRLTALSIV